MKICSALSLWLALNFGGCIVMEMNQANKLCIDNKSAHAWNANIMKMLLLALLIITY
jgi:hypothetical protein